MTDKKLNRIPVPTPQAQPSRPKARYSVTQNNRASGDVFVGYVEAHTDEEAQRIAATKFPKDFIGLKGDAKVRRQPSLDDPNPPDIQRALDQMRAEEAEQAKQTSGQ